MSENIHQIIKNRRLALGLTLKDVATALNIAESTVSRYETKAIQNMGIDKIEALAKVLKCSPAYLMGWQESINDTPYELNTIAAHHDSEDWTDEELAELESFKQYVLSKRKNTK